MKQLCVSPSGVLARSCTMTLVPHEVMPPNNPAVISELTNELGMVTIRAAAKIHQNLSLFYCHARPVKKPNKMPTGA